MAPDPEPADPRVSTRTMAFTMNALGVADILDCVDRRGGDLDFSRCQREIKAPGEMEAVIADGEGRLAPGGYVVVAVRVATLNDSGSEIDSQVHVISVAGPEPFHAHPLWTSDHPGYPAVREAMARGEDLDAALPAATATPRPAVRL